MRARTGCGRSWTKDDVALLCRLCAEGASMARVMQQLDRTEKAVLDKAQWLRIAHGNLFRGKDRRWTDAQLEELKRVWPTGETCADIGRRLGRSAKSVRNKARFEGLSARDRSIVGRPPRMKPEVIDRQAAAWSDIRFDDSPIAARPEAMLRGLPPVNISAMTTCAAATAAVE